MRGNGVFVTHESQAGNTLKRAYTNLIEPTKSGAQALTDLGIIQGKHNALIDETTGKMKPLAEVQNILHDAMSKLTPVQQATYDKMLFGQYALAGTMIFTHATAGEFQNLKEKIEGVNASQAAASMLDTFKGHMQQLSASISTTAKEFGMSFLPALNAILPIGEKMLGWLRDLTPANKAFMMGVLGVGSALAVAGGALAAFGATLHFAKEGMSALKGLFMVKDAAGEAISVFQKFSTAIKEVGAAEAFMDLMNPMGWIVLVGAAVAGAAMLIMQHWGQIKPWLIQLGADIVGIFQNTFGISLPQVLSGFWKTAQQIFNQIGSVIREVWSSISQATEAAWSYIAPVIIGAIQKVSSYWHEIWPELSQVLQTVFKGIEIFLAPAAMALYTIISGVIGFIKAAWDPFWKALGSMLKMDWDFITDVLRTAWDLISGLFKIFLDLATGNWSKAWEDCKQLVKNLIGDVEKLFGDLINNALAYGKNFIDMFAAGIKGAIGGVEDAVKSIAGKIKSFLGFASPTEEGPMSVSDTFAPNFVKMFAAGLANGKSQIADAARSLAQPLADVFGGGSNVSVTGVSVSSDSSGVAAAMGFTQQQVAAIKDYGQAIVDAKERYTAAAKKNDQAAMKSAHELADQYRAKLQAMGVDTTNFGADRTIQQTMVAIDQTISQTMKAAQMQYQTSTNAMMTDNSDYSDNTLTSTTTMMSQWQSMSTGITNTVMKMRQVLQEAFKAVAAAIQLSSVTMEDSMVKAFTAIAESAQRTAQQVVAACNEMRSAMASAGMSPQSTSASITHVSTPVGGYSAIGGIGGGTTIHGGINITVQGANKDGKQVADEIMRQLRQKMNYAL